MLIDYSNPLAGQVEEPFLRHVGLLTPDLEGAISRVNAGLPISQWEVNEGDFPREQVLVGEPCKLRTAVATCAGIPFEIVQPVDSPGSYFSRQVQLHGEFMHHIALVYESSFDRVLKHLLSSKFVLEWHAVRDGGSRHICFLSSPENDGVVFELTNAHPG